MHRYRLTLMVIVYNFERRVTNWGYFFVELIYLLVVMVEEYS